MISRGPARAGSRRGRLGGPHQRADRPLDPPRQQDGHDRDDDDDQDAADRADENRLPHRLHHGGRRQPDVDRPAQVRQIGEAVLPRDAVEAARLRHSLSFAQRDSGHFGVADLAPDQVRRVDGARQHRAVRIEDGHHGVGRRLGTEQIERLQQYQCPGAGRRRDDGDPLAANVPDQRTAALQLAAAERGGDLLLRRARHQRVVAARHGGAAQRAAAVVEEQVGVLREEVDDGEERVARRAVEVADGRPLRHLRQQRRRALILRMDLRRRRLGDAQRRLARFAQLALQLRGEDPDQQQQQRQRHGRDEAAEPCADGPTPAPHRQLSYGGPRCRTHSPASASRK